MKFDIDYLPMAYLDQFLNFLSTLPAWLVYIFLGISAFVENIFPPIPGDTITVFGAFLVGVGKVGFAGVYVSTTLGSLAGFMTLFWVGMKLGRSYFIERDHWFFKAEDIVRAENWFRKYGYLLIFLNRFLPGIRSVISISGGISRLKAGKAALLALISCAIWNLIWIIVGYSIGSNWEEIKQTMGRIMSRYNTVVLILAGAVIIGLIVRSYVKRMRSDE
ncbi:MAG: DedA family protein [Deltaproteobacteria bacterium]|nr:DedA family protein [Deltaproteobacteria bacterium]